MAVGIDNKSESGYQTGQNTIGFDHEILTSRFTGLIVGISLFGAGSITSVTGMVTSPASVKDFTPIIEHTSGVYKSAIYCLPNAVDLFNEEFVITIQVILSTTITCMVNAVSYYDFGGIGIKNKVAGSGDEASLVLPTTGRNSIMFANLTAQATSGIVDFGTGQTNVYNDSGALGSIRGSQIGNVINNEEDTEIIFTNLGALNLFSLCMVELLSITQRPTTIGNL